LVDDVEIIASGHSPQMVSKVEKKWKFVDRFLLYFASLETSSSSSSCSSY
jgi:hypothetical protein